MPDELLDLLNEAVARELGVMVQYMWQNVIIEKMENPDLKDTFRDFALESMKQAMKIGELLSYRGGDPITKPAPINIGNSLKEMLELDLKAGNEIIKTYKKIIELAAKEEDKTTSKTCEEILSEKQKQKNILMCAHGRAARKI